MEIQKNGITFGLLYVGNPEWWTLFINIILSNTLHFHQVQLTILEL